MGVQSYLGDGIKSIQRGAVSLNNLNTVSQTISSVNTSKCVVSVFGTGRATGGSQFSSRTFQITLDSATQITIVSSNLNQTDITGSATWQVVEYY